MMFRDNDGSLVPPPMVWIVGIVFSIPLIIIIGYRLGTASAEDIAASMQSAQAIGRTAYMQACLNNIIEDNNKKKLLDRSDVSMCLRRARVDAQLERQLKNQQNAIKNGARPVLSNSMRH